MPATTTSAGTEQFSTFEERRYFLRCVECSETTSPPPDNRPQYRWVFALEGAKDPVEGGELVRRCWTSQIWNETPGKESHLVILARALCGPAVTQESFEALDYPDLVGLRASALVRLDAKGWPVIDKETMKAAGGKAPVVAQAEAVVASVAAPQRPAPPARPQAPAAPAGPPTITASQQRQVRDRWEAAYRASGTIEGYIAGNYPGRTLAQVRQDEWGLLCEALEMADDEELDDVPF